MQVVITRGLPGSGKSTKARIWQAEKPYDRVYMDRDDLRQMMFGRQGLLPREQEDLVSVVQHAGLRSVLGVGKSIVLADTFLRDDRLDPVLNIAALYGAEVAYIDLRHVPVEVCVERDRKRGESGGREVTAEIIWIMARRYGLAETVVPPE